MLRKYNIAFVPSGNTQLFIEYAAELSQVAPPASYLISEGSIPHVSLCHFEGVDTKIEEIWDSVTALELPTLHLSFDKKRSKCYPGHPQLGGVCWVSLIPDHIDTLSAIHLEIAKIIKTPLNASFSHYDPHLTLFNSLGESTYAHINQSPQIYPPLEAEFNIALGPIDDVGQITEILFLNKATCSPYKL